MEVTSSTSAAGMQDQFLHLLTTQLRHQDPLEPTKQEDFIGQLAQFSTLEGIETLNENFSEFMESQLENQNQQIAFNGTAQQLQEMASAVDLVGSDVTYTQVDSEGKAKASTTGVVEAVVLKDDTIHLRIDDDLVQVDQIKEIGSRATSNE